MFQQHGMELNSMRVRNMAQEELNEQNAAVSAANDPDPFVVNIERATRQNNALRTVLWTGNRLQPVLMSISSENDTGLDNLPNLDQYIRIEQGQGLIQMGRSRDNLNLVRRVFSGYEIYVPARTWFNLTNTGSGPLKFNILYTPPQDPPGNPVGTRRCNRRT